MSHNILWVVHVHGGHKIISTRPNFAVKRRSRVSFISSLVRTVWTLTVIKIVAVKDASLPTPQSFGTN